MTLAPVTAFDSFTRTPTQTGRLDTSDSGNAWKSAATGTNTNDNQLSFPSAAGYVRITMQNALTYRAHYLDVTSADRGTIVLRLRFNSYFNNWFVGACLRTDSESNRFTGARISAFTSDGTAILGIVNIGSDQTLYQQDAVTLTGLSKSSWYWLKFNLSSDGSSRARWWKDGAAEPTTWTLSVANDATTTPSSSGCPGFFYGNATAATALTADIETLYYSTGAPSEPYITTTSNRSAILSNWTRDAAPGFGWTETNQLWQGSYADDYFVYATGKLGGVLPSANGGEADMTAPAQATRYGFIGNADVGSYMGTTRVKFLASGLYFGLGVRGLMSYSNGNVTTSQGYALRLGATRADIIKTPSTEQLVNFNYPFSVNVGSAGDYVCGRLLVVGTSLLAKVWKYGTAEPSSWTMRVTDTTTNAGRPFIFAQNTSATSSSIRVAPLSFVYATTATPSSIVGTGAVTQVSAKPYRTVVAALNATATTVTAALTRTSFTVTPQAIVATSAIGSILPTELGITLAVPDTIVALARVTAETVEPIESRATLPLINYFALTTIPAIMATSEVPLLTPTRFIPLTSQDFSFSAVSAVVINQINKGWSGYATVRATAYLDAKPLEQPTLFTRLDIVKFEPLSLIRAQLLNANFARLNNVIGAETQTSQFAVSRYLLLGSAGNGTLSALSDLAADMGTRPYLHLGYGLQETRAALRLSVQQTRATTNPVGRFRVLGDGVSWEWAEGRKNDRVATRLRTVWRLRTNQSIYIPTFMHLTEGRRKVESSQPPPDVEPPADSGDGFPLNAIVQVTASELNIRSGAGLDASVLLSAPVGSLFTIRGKAVPADGWTWYPIEWAAPWGNRYTGWSAGEYLTLVEKPIETAATSVSVTAVKNPYPDYERLCFQPLTTPIRLGAWTHFRETKGKAIALPARCEHARAVEVLALLDSQARCTVTVHGVNQSEVSGLRVVCDRAVIEARRATIPLGDERSVVLSADHTLDAVTLYLVGIWL